MDGKCLVCGKPAWYYMRYCIKKTGHHNETGPYCPEHYSALIEYLEKKQQRYWNNNIQNTQKGVNSRIDIYESQ
jgi:hypothetical protein